MKKQLLFARLLAGAFVFTSCAASAIDVTVEIAMKDGRLRSEQAALERKDRTQQAVIDAVKAVMKGE